VQELARLLSLVALAVNGEGAQGFLASSHGCGVVELSV
jgi:hypothetical protein